MTAPERITVSWNVEVTFSGEYLNWPAVETTAPLRRDAKSEYVRADLYDSAVAERDEARRERDEARGTNERWERISALSDYVRLDTMWQKLVLDRDAFRRELRAAENERDEAKRLLAAAVEARDEAMREAETLERERDAARAEVERLRPVVNAAVEYKLAWDDTRAATEAWMRTGIPHVEERDLKDAEKTLYQAATAYRAAKEKTP